MRLVILEILKEYIHVESKTYRPVRGKTGEPGCG